MKLITLSMLVFSLNSFATTAVLCGNPAMVDANERTATVHMIFEHPENEIIEDLRVAYKGKDSIVVDSQLSNEGYIIKTKKPSAKIEIKRDDISYCDSDDLFTIKLNSKTVKDCRCFEG